jgi:Fe2+ or Zn2+ uptake regulation protein
MLTTQPLLSKLKHGGFRLTQTRKSILASFVANSKPLSASDISRILSQSGLVVNKTTIYREIEFLLDQGIIKKVRIEHTSDLFELAERPHHHHVICTDCGTIEDIQFKNEHALLEDAQNQTSLTIHDHALEFYGLCRDCI